MTAEQFDNPRPPGEASYEPKESLEAMKKSKLTRSLLAACSIVALSAVMYGCSGGGGTPTLDEQAEQLEKEAQEYAAALAEAIVEAEAALDAAQTALEELPDDASDEDREAAEAAVAEAQALVDALVALDAIAARDAALAAQMAAEAAQAAAEGERDAANAAKAAADEARATAEAAQAAAEAAQAAAEAAQAFAEAAQEDAEAAQMAAEGERDAANAAAAAAAQAQAEAEAAQAAAEAAQAAAETAQAVAEAERDAANDAAAVAEAARAAAEEARAAAALAQGLAAAERDAANERAAAAEAAQAEAEAAQADAEQRATDAEQAQADAEQRATDAEQAQADAEQRAMNAEQAQTDAEQRAMNAEQALTDAQDDLKTAQDELKTAQDDLKTAQDDLKTAQDDLKTAQDKLDAAIERAEMAEKERDEALEKLAAAEEGTAKTARILRGGKIETAIAASRVANASSTVKTIPTASGATGMEATRDAAGMITVDVNGTADDDYAGGTTTAETGDWNDVVLDKTNSDGSTDKLVIYTDIEEPADVAFTKQYPSVSNFLDSTHVKKAASGFFPSDPSATWSYTGADGERPKSFRGTYDGVPGVFACEATVDCTLSTNPKGELNAAGEEWTFTPDAPNTATVKDPDDDYAYFGWWLQTPKDNTGTYVVDVFAAGTSGHEANVTNDIEGTATYSGPAAGLYQTKTYTAGVQTDAGVGEFTATASLTAKFGDAASPGTIGGTVTDFTLDGEASTPWRVILEDALLADGDNEFTGTTEVDFGAGPTASDRGTWGGSFYDAGDNADGELGTADDQPGTVAGMFDAVTGTASLIGAFGATKD